MKQTIVSLLVFSLSCGSVFAAGGNFGGGNGSVSSPFIIEDAADLFAVNNNKSAAYILAADIDLAGYNFTGAPIVYLSSGYFNGNRHVIRNLKINGDSYLGLFGYLKDSTVTDLGLVDADITGRSCIGILTGSLWKCDVYRCYSTGTVDGTAFASGEENIYTGGLIGIIPDHSWNHNPHTHIEDCYSSADVMGGSSTGGMVGYGKSDDDGFASITFYNCYSTGNVSGLNNYLGGGFIGEGIHCAFYNCYSTGNVSSDNTYGGFAGRLVPRSHQLMSNSFWNTQTSGTNTGISVGSLSGLVGIDSTQMGQQSTYSFGGWDFVNEWQLSGYYGRPLLRDNPEPAYYSITVSAGANGSVSPSGDNWYKKAEPLLLIASPDFGYVVDGWYVGATLAQSGGPTYDVGPVLADMDIHVTFKSAVDFCSVSIFVGPGGTVPGTSPSDPIRIERGSELVVKALPDPGNEVNYWSINGSVYQYGSSTFTLYGTQTNTGAISVGVAFKAVMYTVHISSGIPVGNGDIRIGNHGSTVPTGYQQVGKGSSLTITAYPETGYEVYAWQVNGVMCNHGKTTYDLQNTSGNMTLGVLFRNTVFAQGAGTSLSPYQVHDVATLNAVNDEPAAHYIMTNDIDLSGEPDYTDAVIGLNPTAPFLGVFDGNSRKITGLGINSHNDYLGLFGCISVANGLQGQVGNLTIAGVTVRSDSSVIGGLCGLNQSGIIEECRVVGMDIHGSQRVAGLCGYNSGTIRYSSAEGSVTGTYRVGLLTGNCYLGVISDCYAIGNLTMEGEASSGGGISGDSNQATVSNCYASCNIGGAGPKLGSFCGWSQNSAYDGCVTNRQTFEVAIGGTGGGDVGSIAGLARSQMQTREYWAAAGWDFLGNTADGTDDIWRMYQDEVDFPRLWWQFAPGDIAGANGVNLTDFATLGQSWGKNKYEPGFYDNADINRDGIITADDLVILVQSWLD
jgi:hypothetical protein